METLKVWNDEVKYPNGIRIRIGGGGWTSKLWKQENKHYHIGKTESKMPKSSIYGCGIKSSSLHFIDTYGLIATVPTGSRLLACLLAPVHDELSTHKPEIKRKRRTRSEWCVLFCYFTIRKINAPKYTVDSFRSRTFPI